MKKKDTVVEISVEHIAIFVWNQIRECAKEKKMLFTDSMRDLLKGYMPSINVVRDDKDNEYLGRLNASYAMGCMLDKDKNEQLIVEPVNYFVIFHANTIEEMLNLKFGDKICDVMIEYEAVHTLTHEFCHYLRNYDKYRKQKTVKKKNGKLTNPFFDEIGKLGNDEDEFQTERMCIEILRYIYQISWFTPKFEGKYWRYMERTRTDMEYYPIIRSMFSMTSLEFEALYIKVTPKRLNEIDSQLLQLAESIKGLYDDQVELDLVDINEEFVFC